MIRTFVHIGNQNYVAAGNIEAIEVYTGRSDTTRIRSKITTRAGNEYKSTKTAVTVLRRVDKILNQWTGTPE